MQRINRVEQEHDGGALVAPDRQRNAVSGLPCQCLCKWGGFPHRIEHSERHQTQLHGSGPEPVVARGCFLRDQPQLGKADQVRVRLARRHVCRFCQLSQRHGTTLSAQCKQQLTAGFDRLDAAPLLFGATVSDFRIKCVHEISLTI
ncbi:hypothetical protein D3C72_1037360 [compost metagenome]